MSKISLEGNSLGTGTFTIASPNSNSNRTLNLPDASGTVVVTGGAQTIEFAAGTVSAPSITTTGDTNTGIYFPAADTIAFTEGGTEAMRIDSSGNLGLGVTPSAWGSGWRGFNIGSGSGISNTSSTIYLSSNGYNDGTNWKYINSASSSVYSISGNVHSWSIAGSGTAGNSITFTQAMALDASGNLTVGNGAIGSSTPGTTSLYLYNNSLSAGSSSGITGLYLGDVGSGVNSIQREKASVNTAYLRLYTEHGYSTQSLWASGYNGVAYQGNNSTTWSTTSDERVKTNIRPIGDALEKICALNGVHFEYKNALGKTKTSFLAQQFEQVLPGHVHEIPAPDDLKEFVGDDGMMKALDPELIPYLVEAIKELKAELDSAKETNAALEARITAIENGA